MRALITGGAGFVGCNLARRLLDRGDHVTVFDNLSRSGTERNLQWLQSLESDRFEFVHGDVRDFSALADAVPGRDAVFHLAGQVAVTTSVTDPRSDFEVNALGSFNLLEAVRTKGDDPAVVFTSTNKVYGGMEDVGVEQDALGRYAYAGLPEGVSEARGLDFHSPYGCSKGTADQYVHDYARIYGVRSIVFRMSCIYGTRQFGNEDQGWVAHFCIAAKLGRPLSIYGDGNQVRDVLFVDDLVDVFLEGVSRRDLQGEIFNIGGGPSNVISLRQLISELERHLGRPIPTEYGDWRPGDQRVYVSDIRKAERVLGWTPKVSWSEGVERLLAWIDANQGLFA
jgi:CDP-paratose 2-epimerase